MPPKKNQHQLAPLLPAKTPLRDVATKKIYLLGAQIATGGFGRIYSCYEEGSRKENLCCKVEPQGNGPLFTEVNVFQRILRNDQIEEYKKEKKIAWLGVPYVVSTGIFDYKDIKLRYLIIPKYASSLEDMRVKKKEFDVATCLKIVRPILVALQYIHSKDYVHADVKASNILLEDSANFSKAVLVDYGLARMAAQNVDKPDKKKAHNGTAIFTSLDAHRGLNPSFRGDIEILAYNVLYWLTGTLPWHHLEAKVEQVFTAKEAFYKDLDKNLKKELQDHPTTINWMKFLFEVSVKTPYKSEVDFGAIKKVIGHSSTPTASPVKKTATARTSTKRNSADEEPLRAAVKKLKTTPTASRATKKTAANGIAAISNDVDDEEEEMPKKKPVARKRKENGASSSQSSSSQQNGTSTTEAAKTPSSKVTMKTKQDAALLRATVPGMLNFASKGRRSLIINEIAAKNRQKTNGRKKHADDEDSD